MNNNYTNLTLLHLAESVAATKFALAAMMETLSSLSCPPSSVIDKIVNLSILSSMDFDRLQQLLRGMTVICPPPTLIDGGTFVQP